MPDGWTRTLWRMRVLTPLCGLAAAALLAFSLITCRPVFASIQTALLIFNLRMAYIQWFVLQPEWPGRRK